jgi:hypothetical protein
MYTNKRKVSRALSRDTELFGTVGEIVPSLDQSAFGPNFSTNWSTMLFARGGVGAARR